MTICFLNPLISVSQRLQPKKSKKSGILLIAISGFLIIHRVIATQSSYTNPLKNYLKPSRVYQGMSIFANFSYHSCPLEKVMKFSRNKTYRTKESHGESYVISSLNTPPKKRKQRVFKHCFSIFSDVKKWIFPVFSLGGLISSQRRRQDIRDGQSLQ